MCNSLLARVAATTQPPCNPLDTIDRLRLLMRLREAQRGPVATLHRPYVWRRLEQRP